MGRLEVLQRGTRGLRRGFAREGSTRSTILGSLAVSAAQVGVGGLFALASLYLIRTFSTYEYGRMAFGLYVYTLMQAVANLGLSTGVLAETARGRGGTGVAWRTIQALLWVRLATIIPVLLVGLGWAWVAANVLPAMAAVIASIAIVAEFLIGVLAGQLRTRAYVVVVVLQPALFVVLLLGFGVRSAEAGLLCLGTALAISLLVAIAIFGRPALRLPRRPQVALAELSHAVGVARNAYLVGAMHIGFVSFPVILLGALDRYPEAAALSIVLTLVRFAPDALGQAVVSTYFPRVKGVDARGTEAQHLFGTFSRLLAVLTIPAGLGIALLGRPVLGVLFGGAYDELAPYLAIGSVLIVLLPLESLLTWTLIARGRARSALLGVSLRLGVVAIASAVIAGLGSGDFLLDLLVASVTGTVASVVVQALRVHRTSSVSWPVARLLAYTAIAAAAYIGVRAVAGSSGDIALVVAAGLLTLPILLIGAWLVGRPAVRVTGGVS